MIKERKDPSSLTSLRNSLVSAAFNAQLFNYVLYTFYTEESNERKKIGGYTMRKPSLSLRAPVSPLRSSVLNLFSVKTIELMPVRFSLIPSTARVNEL